MINRRPDAGDLHARKIIQEGAGELVRLVVATRQRVGFEPDRPVPISFSAGLFDAAVLRNRFSER